MFAQCLRTGTAQQFMRMRRAVRWRGFHRQNGSQLECTKLSKSKMASIKMMTQFRYRIPEFQWEWAGETQIYKLPKLNMFLLYSTAKQPELFLHHFWLCLCTNPDVRTGVALGRVPLAYLPKSLGQIQHYFSVCWSGIAKQIQKSNNQKM